MAYIVVKSPTNHYLKQCTPNRFHINETHMVNTFSMYFLSFLKTEMVLSVESFPHWRQIFYLSISHTQYHGCCLPDDARSQANINLSMDLVLREFFSRSIRRIKLCHFMLCSHSGLFYWQFHQLLNKRNILIWIISWNSDLCCVRWLYKMNGSEDILWA